MLFSYRAVPWNGLFFVLRILVQWWGFCAKENEDQTVAPLTAIEEGDHAWEVKGVRSRGRKELECSINYESTCASLTRGEGFFSVEHSLWLLGFCCFVGSFYSL